MDKQNKTDESRSVQNSTHENPSTNTHWKSLFRIRSRWKIIILIINFLILCLLIALLVCYLEGVPRNVQQIGLNTTFEHAGKCQPLRLPLCLKYKVPYSYTLIPNLIGHNSQIEITEALTRYDPLISVKCYVLLPLFLCSIYAPKCIGNGQTVPPCRSLCQETIRKCDFFLGVFTLSWPMNIDCSSLPESPSPEICIGYQENYYVQRSIHDCTYGFRCDQTRCLPKTWICDGYLDCEDTTDEQNCDHCPPGDYYCGKEVCLKNSSVCDGNKDCEDGRDERQCLRLNQSSNMESEGKLEIYSRESNSWLPVCGTDWDSSDMSYKACNILGYKDVNETRIRDENEVAFKRISLKSSEDKKQMKSIFIKSKKKCDGDNVTVYLKCQNYMCGISHVPVKPSLRIVGGKESVPGSWPWLAALHGGPDEVFFCGGVLISPWWVLSAAHCVGNQTDPVGWTIKLGMTRRTSSSFFVQKRGVSLIIKHPDFKSYSLFNNDLVLLLLNKPVNFDQFLLPICLPKPNISLIGYTSCIVTGWGKTLHDDDADYQVVINQVEVPIVDSKTCVNWYSIHDVNITEKMVCAGHQEGKKDACQGDSGGPLLCWNSNHWFVAGIVSWGIKCAQPNLPGIYTNVPLYVDWIIATTAFYGHPLQTFKN